MKPVLTLNDPLDMLQESSFRNNLVWLRSFGCQVTEGPGWARVTHDELAEFRALVLLPEVNAIDSAKQVNRAVAEGIAIYLDARVVPTWHGALEMKGYQSGPSSSVRAVAVRPHLHRGGNLVLREARFDEIMTWSDLYSQVFERVGSVREADQRRWRLAASHPEITSLFFLCGAQFTGVCQLCTSDNMVGLYSVGFLPFARTHATLREAALSISEWVTARGQTVIYFERAGPTGDARSPSLISGVSTSRLLLRVYQTWLPPERPLV